MEFYIRQSGWSHYRVYEGRKKLKYTCSSKSHWSWKPYIYSISDSNNALVGSITAAFRFFRKNKIQFELFEDAKVNTIHLDCGSDYSFNYKNQHYTFYTHKEHFKSLFKNGEQVALFNKDSFSVGNSDALQVSANSDENEILMICLAIIDDLGSDNDATFTFDFGLIFGGSKKEFDKYWKPKR